MITQRETISIAKHFNEIKKHPTFPAKEQDILFYSHLSGNTEAREQLINANLRVVVTLAKKFQNKGTSIEDLISQGNLSLVRSLESYKPGLGSTFTSWARTIIERDLGQFLSSFSNTIKTTKARIKRGDEVIPMVPLHGFIQDDGDSQTYEDIIIVEDDLHQDYLDQDEANQFRDVLKHHISKLKPRYQEVIRMHYFEAMSLTEIAKHFGKSREAIRLQHEKAISKLRGLIKKVS